MGWSGPWCVWGHGDTGVKVRAERLTSGDAGTARLTLCACMGMYGAKLLCSFDLYNLLYMQWVAGACASSGRLHMQRGMQFVGGGRQLEILFVNP